MSRSRLRFLLLLLLTISTTWFVWGASFVAISYGLEGVPPLVLMATRFVAAGAIAYGAGRLLERSRGVGRPRVAAWRDAGIVGVGLVAIGMGAAAWSATRLPTGVTALLMAAAPMWVVVLQATVLRGGDGRPGWRAVLGVLVGAAGVAALVAPGHGGSLDVVAVAVLVLANAAWAGASLHAGRTRGATGLLTGVGMQMLVGGVVLGVVAAGAGELGRLEAASITWTVALGWTWLLLPAGIGGFLSYAWLLEHVGPGVASTHAFVNPVVAVALGVLVLGEPFGARLAIALGAIVGAVLLLLLDRPPARRPMRPAPGRDRRVAAAAIPARTGGRRTGWSPAPTPAFAARRAPRPWQATDGMDALAIDAAFDRPFR